MARGVEDDFILGGGGAGGAAAALMEPGLLEEFDTGVERARPARRLSAFRGCG